MGIVRRAPQWFSIALVALAPAGCVPPAEASEPETALEAPPNALSGPNGFDVRGAVIPVEEILRGGPPRDGIPALDLPAMQSAGDAQWRDDELVVGVVAAGEARAYPLAVLVWHELVNDRIGDLPILVSYCPLCGTALVFDRRVGGRERRFGVSGLLYRSDLLMFDRDSDSLWSQISAEAVSGSAAGERLSLVRSRMRTWGDWKREHPQTEVLSPETGIRRPYGRSPYGDYATSEQLMFPVAADRRYHPKMRTVGLRLRDGTARGYPLEEVRKAGGRVDDRFAGHTVAIRVDEGAETFAVDAPAEVEVIEGFWFAWAAFHPGASVFTAP